MKSSRLFHIVYRLLVNGHTSAPALARELEVSVRTIQRDIEALCQAGVPICTVQGRNGGMSLMDSFTMSRALLTEGEKAQLLLAVKSLASATQQNEDALVLKLGALFQQSETD